MREFSLSITEEDTRRFVELEFSNDGGCDYLVIKTFKTKENGEFESTSVGIGVDDARAMVEFLHVFLHEHHLKLEGKKGA